MATGAVNPALLLRGPGILYYQATGGTEPTHTVAASKFPTTAWGGTWVPLGGTDAGSSFSDSLSVDAVQVAESVYDIEVVETGREASWEVGLAEINKTNLRAALNGGTAVTTGTGVTTLTEISPPDIGQSIRGMIGWQSQDDTVRFIGYQALNTSSIDLGFRPGTDKAVLTINWRFEKPATTAPYKLYLAGAARAT